MTEFERAYPGDTRPAGFPGLPADWYTEWETVTNAEGMKLFALTHRKKTEARPPRVLLLIHGYGEHIGRYAHFPHYLQRAFDAIFGYDQQGHGRSEGKRGDAADFDRLADDAAQCVAHVEAKFGAGAELHVFGHSMGGHVALRLALRFPQLRIRTYSVSAPYLALKAKVNPAKRLAAGVLSKLWGDLSLEVDVDPQMVSRDEAVVEHYAADRLNHDRMTPRFFVSMQARIRDTLQRRNGYHHPIQLLLPKADPLIDSAVSLAYFQSIDQAKKRIVEFEGFRHEGMNEVGKEKFFEAIEAFVDEYTQVRRAP